MRRRGWMAVLACLALAWTTWHSSESLRGAPAGQTGAAPARSANDEQRSPNARTPADEPAEKLSTAANDASATEHPELTAAVTPGMALKRLRWCVPMRADGAELRLLQSNWEALGPEAAKLEAAEYERARQWLTKECGPWMTLDDDARESQTRIWRDRAAASADLSDQLWALASATPSAAS